MKDPIERQAAIQPEQQHGRVFKGVVVEYPPYNIWKPYFSIKYTENGQEFIGYGTYKPEVLSEYLKEYFMPSAQPEPRYTEEELRVFAHGISLSLLSKRSAQHWRYDKDTATEIEFLERLYDKVSTDMKGRQG